MQRGPNLMFDDIFEVLERDPEGKKFDKVSRFHCRSDLYEMDLKLDINTDIYPISVGEKLSMALADTLKLDGTATSALYEPQQFLAGTKNLMDKYECVMYGKIFKMRDADEGKTDVYASFGGLLMLLSGDPQKLAGLEVDENVYLLLRKV